MNKDIKTGLIIAVIWTVIFFLAYDVKIYNDDGTWSYIPRLITILGTPAILIAFGVKIRKRRKKEKKLRQESSDSSNKPKRVTEDESLKILNSRLAKGEITSEQFHSMKKDILDLEEKNNVTLFWVCPVCNADTIQKEGKQYCEKCQRYL